MPKERPDSLPSITDKIKTGFGNLYVTISFYNQKPFEVFACIGKSGYSTMADAEALGRLISLALRSGVEPQEVIYQLKGIGGAEPIFTEGGLVQSIPDAIAKVLERHLGEVKDEPQGLLQEHLQDVRRDPARREMPDLPQLRLEQVLLAS